MMKFDCDNCKHSNSIDGAVPKPCKTCERGEQHGTCWEPLTGVTSRDQAFAAARATIGTNTTSVTVTTKPDANSRQVAGDHYKDKAIQPWDYITSNGLGYLEGNIVKYVSRWRDKGGVADLEKARHYLDKLIELQCAKP